jgi:hypothetical protein
MPIPNIDDITFPEFTREMTLFVYLHLLRNSLERDRYNRPEMEAIYNYQIATLDRVLRQAGARWYIKPWMVRGLRESWNALKDFRIDLRMTLEDLPKPFLDLLVSLEGAWMPRTSTRND